MIQKNIYLINVETQYLTTILLHRYRSAFFYFCQELRGKMRELHPEMGVGDIAKELGKLWMSTDLQTKSKYMAIAEEDRARYERVCLNSEIYVCDIRNYFSSADFR